MESENTTTIKLIYYIMTYFDRCVPGN